METHHKRSAFSGKLGFVLSAAGASVGLGNIWRFPYLAAKYGGGIFLLIYILLAVTFGYTMIIAETALGRMTRKSPVGAYSHFGKGKGLAFEERTIQEQCHHCHGAGRVSGCGDCGRCSGLGKVLAKDQCQGACCA